jgi:hypothetical protein
LSDIPVTEYFLFRFWSKVEKGPGCWLWKNAKDHFGYGRFQLGRRGDGLVKAHRLSWFLAFGEIPSGMWVLHQCDVPACVRPDHLKLGNRDDNAEDMVRRGRQRINGAKT